MDPNDPRSKHVWEFFRVVSELKPKAFVMENVKALGANTRWKSTRLALIQLGEEMGYSTRLLILNSADYGVPQLRERMFLVGIRGGGVMPTPPPTKQRITVREILESLPPYGKPGNDSFCRAIITPARNPVLRKSPFAGMLFNGQGRPIDLEQPSPTLPASMGGNRTPIIDQESLETDAEPWIVEYHRHLSAGGKPYSKVPTRLRRLTVEEAARLQGFSQGMKFGGSQCAKFRQIGNSVPPPLAKAVAESLFSVLKSVENRIEWRGDQSILVLEKPGKYCGGKGSVRGKGSARDFK
jgi:DNA (cytosine-5)-methyltransferase 1